MGTIPVIVPRPLDQNQGPSFPFLSLLPFFDEYTLESTSAEINFILLVKRAILLFLNITNRRTLGKKF